MSVVNDIFLGIANLNIGGVVCRNLPEVTLTVEQADLPLRILSPSVSSDASFIAIGELNRITWSIRDLCLWATLTGDEREHFQPMLDYIRGYIDAIKTIKSPAAQSWISSYTIGMGQRMWGDFAYWAVDVALTVEEAL